MSAPQRERTRRVEASRREFLAACTTLALASAGCGSLGARMRSAYLFTSDPPWRAYQPVLRGLIRAVLPLEDPAFRITAPEVEQQLVSLFEFDQDARLVPVEQTLLYFDDLDLFSFPLPLVEAERVARDMEARRLDERAVLDAARETDRRLSATLAARITRANRFTALGLDDQRAYLALWNQSGFLVKRRFHAAARALLLIAAYSQDRLWPVIGYEGPLSSDRGSM